jgi:Holliday junction resolvasome RuvABC endonuclease subunit
MTAPYRALTLGIHPTARGFGWIAFEGPFAPHDWSTYSTGSGDNHRKNERCLAKFRKLINRLKPETVVLESFDTHSAIRSARIKKLCAEIVALAADQGSYVVVYSRKDIQSCFRHAGAQTRDEIAATVARHVPALRHRLPSKRKSWESEDKRLSIFCAAALVLTHYAFGANQLFEDLKDAA